MKVRILCIFAVAVTLCISCADNDVTLGDKVKPFGNVPIRLNVGNLVELQTRGTDAGLQDGTLADGAAVGVFVMSEQDYDSLRVGLKQHNSAYYYDNVECRLNADGTLHPLGTGEMFYPIEHDMRIAVFAYAPYDKNMTLAALFTPDSIGVGVDQSTDGIVLCSDFILGTPVVGNPLRMPVYDYESATLQSATIGLNLRHQRSRITLSMTLPTSVDVEYNQLWNHLDSVLIYAENVPLSAPLGYALDNRLTDYAAADSVLLDTVLMAKYDNVYLNKYANGHIADGHEETLVATCIVLPCSIPLSPSFRIVVFAGDICREVRCSAMSPVIFERGTSMTFRTVVDYSSIGGQ